MRIIAHNPIDSSLSSTQFTVELEEPLSLQQVIEKLCGLHSSSETDAFEKEENLQAICPRCNKIVNPFEHVCDSEKEESRFHLADLVDLSKAPEGIYWIAQDKDKKIWGFGEKPTFQDDNCWDIDGFTIAPIAVSDHLAVDWRFPLKI